MSNVYWAFKNSFKDFNTITFEGPVIQCIDLKRAIMQKCRQQNKDISELNYGLVLCNAQTGEEYRNDSQHIHRNTSVLVKRVPARKSEYAKLTVAPTTKILPNMDTILKPQGDKQDDPFGDPIYGKKHDEQSVEKTKMYAIMKQMEPERHERGKWKKGSNWKAPGTKPPPSYTCYTCNTPGHWIWDCPNKGKKMTVPVDTSVSNPVNNPATDILVMALKKKHGLLNNGNNAEREKGLLQPYCCTLCTNMFRKPTLTPCCKHSFCDECIRQYLIQDDRYTCPYCDEKVKLEELEPNERLARKINKIKEKLGDPNAEPSPEEIKNLFQARTLFTRHEALPSVNVRKIVCLHCKEQGHMFKDCPNKDKEIIDVESQTKQEAVPPKEVIKVKEETPNLLLSGGLNPGPPNLLTGLGNMNGLGTSTPNLLMNPSPMPLLSGLPSNLLPGAGLMNGGLFGDNPAIPGLPSLSTVMLMHKLEKASKRKRKRRSRSRSRGRRSRRHRDSRSRSRSRRRGRDRRRESGRRRRRD